MSELESLRAVCLQVIEERTRLEARLQRVAELLAGLELDDPDAADVVRQAIKLAGGTPNAQLSLSEAQA